MLFLAACGPNGKIIVDTKTPEIHQARPTIKLEDDMVNFLVAQFYADAEEKHAITTDKFTSITFIDAYEEGSNAVGRCNEWEYSDGRLYKREMTILKSYWETASDFTKRSLIYHELGHCALGLGHTPENEKQIMNPYVLGDLYAEANWEPLVDFLFSSQPSPNGLSLMQEPCEYGDHHGI